MTAPLRLGIALQLTDVVGQRKIGDRSYAASVADAAAVVELAGVLEPHFDRLWLTDNLGYRSTSALLGAIAASTRSLDLGTFTAHPHGRSPVDTASMLATVAEVLGGRDLAFGVSRGSRAVTQLHGVDRPLRFLSEYVTTLKSLLAGRAVEVDEVPELASAQRLQAGQRMQLAIEPADVPILLTSTGPKTLALSGAVADGVQFVSQQPMQSAALLADPTFPDVSGLRLVDEARARAGRDGRFLKVYGISVSVAEDRDDAVAFARRQVAGVLATKGDEQLAAVGIDPDVARTVRAHLDGPGGLAEASRHVPSEIVLRLIATGTPAEVAAQVADAVERSRKWGFEEHFLCFPLGPDLKDAVETIVSDVLPELRHGALL